MSEPNPLVEAEWLKAHLADPNLRIIDASWYLPAANRDPEADYLERHIPGAVRFRIDQVADTSSGLPHMLATPEAFAAAVGALGLGNDSRIVVYAGDGVMAASRVWWNFRVMGHDAVHVLDGGLPAWIDSGGPLEAGPAHAPAPAVFTPRFRPGLVRDFEQVTAALKDPAVQVLDARPFARFTGEAPEPRGGLASGHMPGAHSLPNADLVGTDGKMLRPDALREAFAKRGLPLGKAAIASCGSGVSACVTALALARLGHWNTAIYDGSWSEWGARADAPVVTGAA